MLERASACLQAGARDSLKRTPKATKVTCSRRLLHHAFWNRSSSARPSLPPPLPLEGPFLDFLYPPQALAYLHCTRSLSSYSSDPHEKRKTRRLSPDGFAPQPRRGYASQATDRADTPAENKSSEEEAGEASWSETSVESLEENEGVLLDDYPEPASGKSDGGEDNGEKEQSEGENNARWENLVRNSAHEEQQSDVELDPLALSDLSGEDLVNPDIQNQAGRTVVNELRFRHLEEEPDSFGMDSPGDLAEVPPTPAVTMDQESMFQDTPESQLRSLQRILSQDASFSGEQLAPKVWQLYMNLPEDDQSRPRLKERLLAWLVQVGNESATARAITVYWSIDVQDRTLLVYQSAIKAFWKRHQWDVVRAVHKEALENIENGQQVTVTVVSSILAERRFSHLVRVFTDHDEHFARQRQQSKQQLLSIKLLDEPDILKHAAAFAERLEIEQESKDRKQSDWLKSKKREQSARINPSSRWIVSRGKMVPRPRHSLPSTRWVGRGDKRFKRPVYTQSQLTLLKQICSRIAGEVVKPAIDRLFSESKLSLPEEGATLRLLRYLGTYSSNAKQFFEPMLRESLLWRQSMSATIDHRRREQMHRVISRIYWIYRKLPGAKLDPALQTIWLERLVKRMQHTRVEERSEVNVTASMVVEDWQKWHGQFSSDVVAIMMHYSAANGHAEAVKKWTSYLETRFHNYADRKKSYPHQILVHTRRKDLASAKAAFESVTRSAKALGQRPDIECWNALLHSHAHLDDIEGAYSTFRALMNETDLVPDHNSFYALMSLQAHRGDIDGVNNLIRQYDAINGGLHHQRFVTAQMTALAKLNHATAAEECLTTAVDNLMDEQSEGSLTKPFNVLLTLYAKMADIDAVMRLYRLMKEKAVPIDSDTYRPIMRVLCNYRQANAAWSICKNMTDDQGLPPDASHYATIMKGFVYEDEPQKAISAYKHMIRANIRPSVPVAKYLLMARSHIEKQARDLSFGLRENEPTAFNQQPLLEAIEQLREIVESITIRDIASPKAVSRIRVQELFSPALNIVAGRANLDVAEQLFRESREAAMRHNQEPWPVLELCAGLLKAFYYAGEDAKLEEYWKIVKPLSDQVAYLPPLPDFVAMREAAQQKQEKALRAPKGVEDAAEIGFPTIEQQSSAPSQPVLTQDLGPKPAPGRSHILSRHFQFYFKSLVRQNRASDGIREFTRFATQGYTFDQISWNRLIEYLCSSNPPLVTLAFTLTERFLIKRFPGWTKRSSRKFSPRRSARSINLQHIRARYLPANVLMPQYRTMILLVRAFTQLRTMDAQGYPDPRNLPGRSNSERQQLRRYIGTLKDIVEKAPRTLRACRTMPRLFDKWQQRHLQGVGWHDEYPGLPALRKRARVVNEMPIEAKREGPILDERKPGSSRRVRPKKKKKKTAAAAAAGSSETKYVPSV